MPRAVLGLTRLEDRSVPATFYVDPNAALEPDGKYTFNLGQPGVVNDLVLGTDIFLDLNSGLAQANTAAGTDTLRLAVGDIVIDNSAGTVLVTETLSVVGSGRGATRVLPSSNTIDEFGPDAAVLRADNTTLNLSDLTLDGNSPNLLVGQFVRYQNGASGAVFRVRNLFTVYTPTGNNSGSAFVATGAGTTLNVADSSFDAVGAVGVGYQLGAGGRVSGSSFSGGGDFAVYGVLVGEGSTNVLVTGNTFSNFTGANGGWPSAGVLVSGYDPVGDTLTNPAFVTILGNTFTANSRAVIVGTEDSLGNPDSKANALIQHNNIAGNDAGIETSLTPATVVDARFNWWGSPVGPLATGNLTAAGNNAGGVAGSEVGINVRYRDAAITPNAAILTGPTPLLVADSPSGYRAELPPATVTEVVRTTANPLTFRVTFDQPVFALDMADFVVTGPGSPVVSAASGGPTVYFVTVTGVTPLGEATLSLPASAVGIDGLFTVYGAFFGGAAAGGPGVGVYEPAAGVPSQISIVGGTNQMATVNLPFGNALAVRVVDGSGNPVAGVPVTFTAPASGASATFPGGATSLTDADGNAAVSATADVAIASCGGP